MKTKLLALLLLFSLFGCSQTNVSKSPEPVVKPEMGAIPAEVTWRQHAYCVTMEEVDQVGESLGIAQVGLNDAREVFKIPGKDPNTELAVSTSRQNTYLRAVLNK